MSVVLDQGVGLLREFKAFALRGNVVELAVGVIIGAAFGKIVDSLVKHVIMPFISAILPVPTDWSAWKLALNGKEVPYGLFVGEIVNFVLVAAAVFIFIVKFLGWVSRLRQEPAASPAAPPPTPTEALLAEIRDLLKARQT
jgi:large conductance mechanosensitive channel